MARSTLVASVMLVMLAGAHLAAAASAPRRLLALRRQSGDGISLEGVQLEPIVSSIPSSVSSFNIASIEPLLPLLNPDIIDPALLAEVAQLVPLLDVEWLKAVLPYLNDVNPKVVGELFRALLPLLQTIPSSTVGEWIKILGKVNPKTVGALVPALSALKPEVVARLVDSLNGMDPDVLVGLANALASLKPEAWDALIALVNLGVPAINLAGSQLSMLPINVPAPPAFTGRQGFFRLPSFFSKSN
ncbi:hypothetical protein Rsub_04449 [Raphidocelis subcapitata]|uniref:Uncharacterized protein n=1 Tax=Raphidocelis subcapitata TaxID=307507 RepID=A0A2V0NZJ7_9CHLO|nr:hypothetical protein Rsub_04449 [Raphidocelis subcapitata]|eukprot:GBF92102.1 hypothetical protein Rsub_04449 [Raphidocelis subcapitata]